MTSIALVVFLMHAVRATANSPLLATTRTRLDQELSSSPPGKSNHSALITVSTSAATTNPPVRSPIDRVSFRSLREGFSAIGGSRVGQEEFYEVERYKTRIEHLPAVNEQTGRVEFKPRSTQFKVKEDILVNTVTVLTLRVSSSGQKSLHTVALAEDSQQRIHVVQHTSPDMQSAVTPTASIEVSADGSFTHEKEAAALRTMSVNIWNYNHWNARSSVLREELALAKADVLGFQEVRAKVISEDSDGAHQMVTLVSMLPKGFQFIFRAAMTFDDNGGTIHEGLAIASRHAVVATNVLHLSQDARDPGDFHRRICLHALVKHPSGAQFNVLNTHMSLSYKARQRALREIGEWVEGQLQALTNVWPTLLLGDFNGPADEILGILSGYGFKDPGGKSSPRDTFPSWDPVKRIDLVLVREAQFPIQVTSSELFGLQGKERPEAANSRAAKEMLGKVYSSDHGFPLLEVEFDTESMKINLRL